MEPPVGVGDYMLKVAQGGEGVVGGEGGDGGAGGQEARAAAEVVVEVGGGVGNDADGEVDAGDGLEDLDVGRGGVDARGVDGAEIAAVEQQEETGDPSARG